MSNPQETATTPQDKVISVSIFDPDNTKPIDLSLVDARAVLNGIVGRPVIGILLPWSTYQAEILSEHRQGGGQDRQETPLGGLEN